MGSREENLRRKVFPLRSTNKRIQPAETLTGQISSKRTNLKLHLPLCTTTESLQTPTMQSMQIDSASLPLFRGGGGSLGEFLMETPNMMMDLEMDLLATGNSSCRAFNSAENDLNTPDISADLDIGKMLAANIDTHTVMETKEDVWGHESFDIFSTMDYGLCLPATLVEGSLADSADSLIVPDDTVPAALEENIDLLQWIVEDQDIDPLAACDVAVPEQPAESARVSVIVPVSAPSTSFYIKTEEQEEVKVKLEPLGEDEKYRKMRRQNNDASKRCRENRKRKAKEMEEELAFLEEKNQNLRETFESMEREVKAMKRQLLSNISSN